MDPRLALAEFQGDIRRLLGDASGFEQGGVSPKRMLEEVGLGINELEGLLRNKPPGLDEYVALANVLDPGFGDDGGHGGGGGGEGGTT